MDTLAYTSDALIRHDICLHVNIINTLSIVTLFDLDSTRDCTL
jgi:hypothetical protein